MRFYLILKRDDATIQVSTNRILTTLTHDLVVDTGTVMVVWEEWTKRCSLKCLCDSSMDEVGDEEGEAFILDKTILFACWYHLFVIALLYRIRFCRDVAWQCVEERVLNTRKSSGRPYISYQVLSSNPLVKGLIAKVAQIYSSCKYTTPLSS